MKNTEIELKFRLLNVSEVEAFLADNASFLFEAAQHDLYFNPPHRDFLKDKENICEWLRLRISDGTAQINYKDWLPHDAKIKSHCTEFEASVDSYEQLRHILDALDFKPLIEVKKNRKSWNYLDTEVSIDSVAELGEYIEIEYKGALENVEEARKYLLETVKKLGAEVGDVDLEGYPFGLMKGKGLI